MGCPSAAELDALFDAADPARASAMLAHVRECARCTEALSARDERRPPISAPLAPRRKRPRPAVILIAAVGLALIGLSRAIGRRHPTDSVAPQTSR